jgi:large subunit ribosomal protein L4
MTLEAASYSEKGKAGSRVTLPGEVFDGIVNMPVMHQAVKAYLANQRQGTASTKTRGLVVGGNQKPWKQKGTGRARQGSTRAPHFVGGGTVFGPSPRKYTQVIPRKIRALARKSALNARAREGMVIVIDSFGFEKPSTREMLSLLDSAGVAGRKVLILTDGVKPNVYLSARNLERAHVLPYSDASTYHVLWSDVVLIEGSALGGSLESAPEREGEEAPAAPRKAKSAKKEKPAKSEKAVKAAKKSAAKEKKKTARKAAGKSSAKKTTASAKKTTAKKSAAKKKGK